MSTLTLQAPWIAIRTRARAEKAVRDCLDSQNVDVFLPTTVRARTWSDRIKHIDWPLFPGYCFARFVEGQRLTILKTPGVAGIVSFAGNVALVPAAEIEGLRAIVESDLVVEPVPYVAEGDRVEVIRGPLKGIVGRVLQTGRPDHGSGTETPATYRVILSVETIAQSVSVEVDAGAVKRLDAGGDGLRA